MGNIIMFPPTATDADKCVWVESAHSTWITSCGQTIEEMELTPEEGGLHFCAYCGKELIQELHPND